MNNDDLKKTYRFYAPFYDYIFGRIVESGRRRAVAKFPQRQGDRLLEIGVGTGRSLRYYQPHVQVTGIDLSPEMLERARKRFLNSNHPQVKDLLQMDAQSLDFPDQTFDGAVAMYVASVVPDPSAMMREMFRVCKPGSPIVVLNHFASDGGFFRRLENKMAPLSRRLGFRPDFGLEHFVNQTDFPPQQVERVNVGGYWKLLEFRSPPSPAGEDPAEEMSCEMAPA